MHVIWKRPDGFHDSSPQDFRVINLRGDIKFWLHKENVAWFPFQISGDWKGSDNTKKINTLMNLIDANDENWTEGLKEINSNSLETRESCINDLINWVDGLKQHLKGDTWETEIMQHALKAVEERLKKSKSNIKN